MDDGTDTGCAPTLVLTSRRVHPASRRLAPAILAAAPSGDPATVTVSTGTLTASSRRRATTAVITASVAAHGVLWVSR